jgi:Domain of unknown function (DUF4350)
VTTAAPPAPARGGQRERAAGSRPWVAPLAIIGLILLAAVFVGLFAPTTPTQGFLDPDNSQPPGTHALADILGARGTLVDRVTTTQAAVQAARGPGTAIVVTSPGTLTRAELGALASTTADLVIVGPDRAALAVLAPGVSEAASTPVGPLQPACALPAAELAGSADMGGIGLRLAAGQPGITCYPVGGLPSLVRYTSGPRSVTVLGTGAPLENQNLARLGNAALTLNLLGAFPRLAWLVPQSTQRAAAGGGKSLWQLIPRAAYLVAAELAVAVLLTALWRARRLGPLVAERLPVVVRAAETTEGHARLYQARRARDHAAAALRTATLDRLKPAVGLPAAAAPDAITSALAARSALLPARLETLLFGPPPSGDGALIRLAEDLDALEREVRSQ